MERRELRISVDAAHRTPAPPHLFGHNLEHTRAAVYGGLSAQLLRNRKFAGKPRPRLGTAAEWSPVGSRAFFRTDAEPYVRHKTENGMVRRNEANAQLVQNPLEGPEAGIAQGGLYLSAGVYDAAVAAKSSRPVSVRVQLTDKTETEVYAEAVLPLSGGGWERLEAALAVPRDDPDARIRFTFTSAAEVSFGAVSLLPKGSFRGMRRDVVDRLREIGVSLLRWPGGNFAGEYRWRDMFLPADERAPLQAYMEEETQPYSRGYDMHEIDTDDFIALCREIGAEPFLTVNLQWDDPAEIAAWVEYCNGPADSVNGALRAGRGHPEPYGVKYWSLGNEMGYGHMEGPMEPGVYAARAKAAAEAMLAVSPDLILCSSGPYEIAGRRDEWIEGSALPLRGVSRMISFHTYDRVDFDFTSPEGIRRMWEQAAACPMRNVERLRSLRRALPDDVLISYDEWNLWYAWYRRPCTVEGMYTASMLHAMLLCGTELGVPVLCYFQPVHEGCIDIEPSGSSLSPNGQAFALLSAHRGGEVCRTEGAQGHEAAATVKEGILSLTVLNPDPRRPLRLSAEIRGRVLGAKLLAAGGMLPGSRFEERELAVSEEQGFAIAELPPASLCLIRAEAPETNE